MSHDHQELFTASSQQEIWNSLVSEPGIGVSVVSRDGVVLYANAQSAEMFLGTTPENAINKPLSALFPPEWVAERLKLIERVIQTGEPLVIRTIWRGRQIRSTLRAIGSAEDSDTRVLGISRAGGPCSNESDTQLPVVESEVAAFGDLAVLTSKELEVLALLGQGLRLKEIAEALHRSPKTIDNHRTSIGRKLNLADRVDLAQIASDAGLEIRDAQRKRVDPNNFGDD